MPLFTLNKRFVKLSSRLVLNTYCSNVRNLNTKRPHVRRTSCLQMNTNQQNVWKNYNYSIHKFSTNGNNPNNNNNNDNNNGNDKDQNNVNNNNTDSHIETSSTMSNNTIHFESQNQKSVTNNRKVKSLVPFMPEVLTLAIQKPLFPGFSSVLQVVDEELKSYFLSRYQQYLISKQLNINNDNNSNNDQKVDWIGAFLYKPKNHQTKLFQSNNNNINVDNTSNNTKLEIQENNNNENNDCSISNNNENVSNVWHTMLDEVNCDLLHRVPTSVKQMDDIYEYGTLVKIDYDDPNTNIHDFYELQNLETQQLNTNENLANKQNMDENMNNRNVNSGNELKSHKKRKNSNFAIQSMSDPMYLKIIGARRIRLESVAMDFPFFTKIRHLQPQVEEDKMTLQNNKNMNKDMQQVQAIDNNQNYSKNNNDMKINDTDSEIKLRAQFNIAAELLRNIIRDDPDNREDLMNIWRSRHAVDIGFFCDFAANLTNSTPRELQSILESVDYHERLAKLIFLLKREERMMDTREKIIKDVNASVKKENTEKFLNMIMVATKKRLFNEGVFGMGIGMTGANNGPNSSAGDVDVSLMVGNTNEKENKTEKHHRYHRIALKFIDRIKNKTLPPDVKEIFLEGVEKMIASKPPNTNMDVETTKQYLDWISSLPWDTYSEDNTNIIKAKQILDEQHYGMKDVKERILEIIASNILNNSPDKHSKILCFVGPPGVGKTSIGESIARALNKQFYKFSLGGTEDSHLLKGFLRTYVGANPGKLIYGLKQCGTSNPVILIDEIDKMGARHSDPSHALLEILDPTQNHKFSDNYLDFPIDLSRVLFLCTANDESKINPILSDRLHIIRLSGYDENEKLSIAKKYLIPKALSKAGLTNDNIHFNDNVLYELLRSYCRESGVRSLQHHIEKICFKAAFLLVQQGVDHDTLRNGMKKTNIGHENTSNMKDENSMSKDKTNNSIDTKNEKKTNINDDNKDNNTLMSKLYNQVSYILNKVGITTQNNNNDDKNKPATLTPSQSINIEENHIHDIPVISLDEQRSIPFVNITPDNLKTFVGVKRFSHDRTYDDIESTPPGVVTGLAYNRTGGSTTYIETVKYHNNSKSHQDDHNKSNTKERPVTIAGGNGGSLKCTGSLGKVMKESTEIAYCLARTILSNEIDENNHFFNQYHIHLHAPEGAISKDGPSAGITIVTALLSLALNHKISPDIAMTGEVTLTGKILKIGGLKEKMLAAKRAKIHTLLLPFDNKEDFEDNDTIPLHLKQEFKNVHFVKHYNDVLNVLFPNFINNDKICINLTNNTNENQGIYVASTAM